MGNKIRIIALIFCFIFSLTSCSSKPNPAPQAEVRPQTVAVTKLEKTSLVTNIVVFGKISPAAEVKVAPKSSGKVDRIIADVGQKVSAGDLLFELDDRDLRLQLEKLKIQGEDARRSFERKKALYESGGVSKLEYEQAESAYALLKISIQQAENDLANSQVSSPIDGYVAARNVNQGEFVSNNTAAFSIVNLDMVEINSSLLESEINIVKPGQEAQVLVPAVTETIFAGQVTKASPYADSKDKTFPVWVSTENKDHILKPGMFAEIRMAVILRGDVITVPEQSIITKNGRKVVYLAVDNMAVEKQVKTGLSQRGITEITEGLKPGDLLITSGLQTMKDGKAITVQGERAPRPGN